MAERWPSGSAGRRSPTSAARLADPALRLVDCRWYLGRPGEGRAAYDAGHLPGAIHLDIDTDWPAHEGPGRHPLPDPAGSPSGSRQPASATNTSWSPTTTSAAGWRRACGGCSTISGTTRSRSSTAGIGAWIDAGLPLDTRSADFPPAASACGPWTGVIDREGAAGVARLGPAARRPGRSALPRRDRADRCLPGHIPTACSAPTDGNLGPDGRFLTPAELAERYRELGADGSIGPVVVRAGAACRPRTTPWPCGSPACPTPILYPGSYSDWTQQGWPVATGEDPGEPPGGPDR